MNRRAFLLGSAAAVVATASGVTALPQLLSIGVDLASEPDRTGYWLMSNPTADSSASMIYANADWTPIRFTGFYASYQSEFVEWSEVNDPDDWTPRD